MQNTGLAISTYAKDQETTPSYYFPGESPAISYYPNTIYLKRASDMRSVNQDIFFLNNLQLHFIEIIFGVS